MRTHARFATVIITPLGPPQRKSAKGGTDCRDADTHHILAAHHHGQRIHGHGSGHCSAKAQNTCTRLDSWTPPQRHQPSTTVFKLVSTEGNAGGTATRKHTEALVFHHRSRGCFTYIGIEFDLVGLG